MEELKNQIKTPIPVLLLDEQKDPLPKWMKFYIPVSLGLYVCLMIYSLVYIIFVGVRLSDPLTLIQYEPIYELLEYSSYSLLPPFMSFIVFPMMMVITRKKVKMEDGEFFGVLGGLLLLSLISAYDATGIRQLYAERGEYLSGHNKTHLQKSTETYDPKEKNELAWQYAWSTKPSCARIHAINNQDEDRINKKHAKNKKDESIEKPHFRANGSQHEILAWFFNLKTKDQILNAGFTATIDSRSSSNLAYIKECKNTSDSTRKVDVRYWMVKMHTRLKCCGPRGYNDFRNRIKSSKLSSCKGKTYYKRGCGIPYNRFLHQLLYEMMIVYFLEAATYVVAVILACFHFAAMKYDASGVVKEYSLLDLDGTSGRFGQSMVLAINKKSTINPVEELFHEANKRAESRQHSMQEHFPAAFARVHTELTKRKDHHHGHSDHTAVEIFAGTHHSGHSRHSTGSHPHETLPSSK